MADFVLGRLKFKWRGDWSISTAYLIDDIVKYGGNTYVCVTNHTSQSTTSGFYTDLNSSSYWQLHTEGLFFKGDWQASTFYKVNDLVKYGAYQYRCILQYTSGSDFAIGSNWQVFSEGLQWEDSYNAGTTYQDGDVVSYGGYTYVYVSSTPSAGNTPTDNSFWDVITTGYNNTGTYSHGTTYKTGDVVRYGGNSYVVVTNNTNEYPANTDGSTNTSYWELVLSGFLNRGTYSSVTTYNIGDVVRYTNSSYLQLKDRQTNVEPGTDATVWQTIAEGDPTSVTQDRGDLIYRDATQSARLPIGVSGSVLTTDGIDPIWSNAEGRNVIYVANSGSDTNPGTQFLPYKTISKALSVATSGDIVDFAAVGGGVGGIPGTYDLQQTSSSGTGTGATIRVVVDSSSTPSVIVTDGGSGHIAGNVITFGNIGPDGSTVQGGGMTDITIDVISAGVGDVVFIKNGVYREILPLRIPPGVTVQGESLRGTEVRPVSGFSTQVATLKSISGGTGGTPGTYNYIHQSSSSGSGQGLIVNIVTDGSSTATVTVYHGGFGYEDDETITITDLDETSTSQLGGASNITFQVNTRELSTAANMFLLNDTTNLVQMSMKGLIGIPSGGGTGKAAVTSLDPTGSIITASPYVQNCSSVNAGATGIQIDGNLHSSGNKSILANDFTQINSDGRGVHALARGRGEMVSVFTYYCAISFFAESGGFIRGLNCSSAYGEKGAVADGTDILESSVHVQTRGELLKYNATTFSAGSDVNDISDMIAISGQGTATVTGNTSGASATIFRTNISLDYLHIENRTGGNFQNGETVTITKEDTSTFTINLASSDAQTNQIGPLIAIKSGTTALTSGNIIQPGANILFVGDANYYRISAVSETDTSGETALIRLTSNIESGNAKADSTSADITQNFSNVRLTAHDFLDIGTGGFADTNYPGAPIQAADQQDEVDETDGGRVYFVSSDQKGDFRVGDLFRIEQATGVATLNADAFDLSGITELQLGSIGAQLGATINEFSTDVTLSGDSNSAVPTERSVLRYLTQDNAGITAWVPPTGTTAERPTGGNLYSGAFRFNSSLVTWEGYNGSQWTTLGGGNPWSTKTSANTGDTIFANDRIFVNTSGGVVTLNLPASPNTGDTARFIDLAATFDTNNFTIGRNGNRIMSLEENLVISTENAAIGLVYSGATYGWKLVENL
jgi:hypothetical protein